MMPYPSVFCALDTDDIAQAKSWAAQIGPITGGLKLGMEFVNSHGPQGIETIREACPDAALFIDLKFHDIPNTVAGAVRTLSRQLAPMYLNLHASGGLAMMEAAREACEGPTKLLAVTILTSLNHDDLCEIGYQGDSAAESVIRLAKLTEKAGLDGVVCSAHEITALRTTFGSDFILMVPGIRPAGARTQDQTRVMDPPQALQTGASHLVIGRPITQAADPATAAQKIMDGLKK